MTAPPEPPEQVLSCDAPGTDVPSHRVHVVPWLRGLGSRLLLPNWLAITLGHHVVTWRSLRPDELAHELEHVRQWKRFGSRFAARYLRASCRSWRAGTGWYAGNRFEVAARTAARTAAARARAVNSHPQDPPR